jgi:hypothetical protein
VTGIQQGGDQGDAAAAEAPDGGGEAEDAHGDLCGQECPLLGGENFGLLVAFGPEEQTVVMAQAPGFAEVHFAAGVQACHHIHPLWGQAGQRGVFPEGAIAQQDIPLFELLPQCAQQTQVMVP